MTKRKKELLTITAEERLKEALVPENKQPYQIPNNWCWVYLHSLYQINPSNIADGLLQSAFVPMEKIEPGFTSKFSYDVQPWAKAKKGHTQFADGDVAFAKISPSFENRKSMVLTGLPNGIGAGTTELIVLRQHEINPYYTLWLISQEEFIRRGVVTYSGVVGQQRISMDYVRNYPVPVPPAAEQQRIVDRIESLFSKLDEAEEKLQSVLDSFESRRAAILHKAFTGELTTKWREKNNISLSNWEFCSIDEICKSLKYGTAKKSKESGKVAVIRMGNLQQGEIDWTDLVYSDDDDDIVKYNLVPGDVLFNRTNSAALVGKTSIYRGEQSAIYAGYLIKLDYDRSRILGDYLNYQLNTLEAKEYCNSVKTDGVNQSNINAKKIGAFKLNVAKIEEQREIVRLIDNFMANERHSKELVDTVLKQIESIKRSILSKAFHGELGTNNPEDECAKELIKRILG